MIAVVTAAASSDAVVLSDQKRYLSLSLWFYVMSCLQWRHNECHGVSNHRHLDCLLSRLFSHISGTTYSASLAFVRGFHRWPTNSPHKGQVTRIMFPFDDVIMFMTLWTEKCFREALHCDNNWIKETSSLRVTVHQNCQGVAYRACFLFIFI